MTVTTTASSPTAEAVEALEAPPAVTPGTEPGPGTAHRLVDEDLLVEDVSIDGMCGVY